MLYRAATQLSAALTALWLALHGTAAAAASVPERGEMARLIWSTLIAIDHANRTGNYSVVRDLGAPSFRDANDAARLAAIFAQFRKSGIDLGRVVLHVPQYAEPPRIVENGMLSARGVIPMRPEGVAFDLLFRDLDGEWRLFGIAIAPEVLDLTEEEDTPPRKPEAEPEASLPK